MIPALADISRVRYRVAKPADAAGLAALHADSWRRHYRGAYSDAFLDHDVVVDRESVWAERMSAAQKSDVTLIAELDGEIVGFAHAILDHDPSFGALLENLHVANHLKRAGIGAQLLVRVAQVVVERTPSRGLYLWVLEQNTAAQAFYRAMGGTVVERGLASPPGGDPSRLSGSPQRLRIVWPDPTLCRHRAFQAR